MTDGAMSDGLRRVVDAQAPVMDDALETCFGGTPDPLTRQRL